MAIVVLGALDHVDDVLAVAVPIALPNAIVFADDAHGKPGRYDISSRGW